MLSVFCVTASKFAVSQSEAMFTVEILCDLNSLTEYRNGIMVRWPCLGTLET